MSNDNEKLENRIKDRVDLDSLLSDIAVELGEGSLILEPAPSSIKYRTEFSSRGYEYWDENVSKRVDLVVIDGDSGEELFTVENGLIFEISLFIDKDPTSYDTWELDDVEVSVDENEIIENLNN